jgi:transposase
LAVDFLPIKGALMAYMYGERAQTHFLPSSIEDYIAVDDPVRAYDAFIEQIDLDRLGIRLNPDHVGHPEFDPRAMLKLLVYGYSYGTRSSRKLERATHHNLSFIWLIGGLKPDHKTIARFRRNHRDALKNLLKQSAQLCIRLGLTEGNTLFVDGTTIRANASMKNSWTTERCQNALNEIDQRIESLLKECDDVDQAEEAQPSRVKMDKELQNQDQLKSKIRNILQELEQNNKTATNTTDPESGRFRKGGPVEAAYNCQIVVDDKHGLIVQGDVTSENNDARQFAPQLEAAHHVLGKSCQTACADAGYTSPDGLKKMLDQGVDVIVPIVRHSDFRDHFTYDSATDSYQCSEGHRLTHIGDHKSAQSRMYRISDASLCLRCPRFGICTKSTQGRRVERPYSEPLRERLEARYQQTDAQTIARRRKMRVEHPFGHLKHNLGMRFFLLRGLSGVRAEAALAATCFNMTRLIKLLGIQPLLATLSS